MSTKILVCVLALTLVGEMSAQTNQQTSIIETVLTIPKDTSTDLANFVIGLILKNPTIKYAFCAQCNYKLGKIILDNARNCAINNFYPEEGAQAYQDAQTYSNDPDKCAQTIVNFGLRVASENLPKAVAAVLTCGLPALAVDYARCENKKQSYLGNLLNFVPKLLG